MEITKVHLLAARQQGEVIEQLKDFAARLMNAAKHCTPISG
jgi:hypothetical protein